jgi:hypothetical protein
MIYYEKGSTETSFSAQDLKQGLFEAFEKMGAKQKGTGNSARLYKVSKSGWRIDRNDMGIFW